MFTCSVTSRATEFRIALLAFGLLALSHTPAIAGFGLVLSVGVFVSFLLSPLALPYRKGVEPCA